MAASRRPVSVWVIGCVYLLVGTAGFLYHARELGRLQPDSVWVALVELIAIVCGAFMLRGQNWARWLALGWMAFHVVISWPVPPQFVVHALFLVVIAWCLFRPDAARYFRPPSEPA